MLSRRLSLLAAIIFVGAAVRFILPVSAGDEWLPITPEELKMTSDPKAPGAPAPRVFLFDITVPRIHAIPVGAPARTRL